MLCRSTCFNKRSSSVDIFILSNYFTKKVAVQKSNCHKKLLILTKWLLGRSFVPKNWTFWKNNCCEEMILSKTELLKKPAALKKEILRKSNFCVEVVKEVRRSSFSENKAALKKSLNMPEGRSPFEKKNEN